MEILNYQGFEFSHRRLKIKDIFNLLYLSLTLWSLKWYNPWLVLLTLGEGDGDKIF